jgi:hypothetical protein
MSNTDVLRLTEPLGYLGDPRLAEPLVAYVRNPAKAARSRRRSN